MRPCWRATPCCSALRQHCWKNCSVRLRKAAAASCARMPTSDCFVSTRSATCPSMTARRTCSTKSSTAGFFCIEGVGFLSFDARGGDLLYKVLNRRYERKSVILTTNRAFKEWNEVFPNATCIVTLLDRLLHHADVTVMEGESYRVR